MDPLAATILWIGHARHKTVCLKNTDDLPHALVLDAAHCCQGCNTQWTSAIELNQCFALRSAWAIGLRSYGANKVAHGLAQCFRQILNIAGA